MQLTLFAISRLHLTLRQFPVSLIFSEIENDFKVASLALLPLLDRHVARNASNVSLPDLKKAASLEKSFQAIILQMQGFFGLISYTAT